jgi:hypothetical protein
MEASGNASTDSDYQNCPRHHELMFASGRPSTTETTTPSIAAAAAATPTTTGRAEAQNDEPLLVNAPMIREPREIGHTSPPCRVPNILQRNCSRCVYTFQKKPLQWIAMLAVAIVAISSVIAIDEFERIKGGMSDICPKITLKFNLLDVPALIFVAPLGPSLLLLAAIGKRHNKRARAILKKLRIHFRLTMTICTATLLLAMHRRTGLAIFVTLSTTYFILFLFYLFKFIKNLYYRSVETNLVDPPRDVELIEYPINAGEIENAVLEANPIASDYYEEYGAILFYHDNRKVFLVFDSKTDKWFIPKTRKRRNEMPMACAIRACKTLTENKFAFTSDMHLPYLNTKPVLAPNGTIILRGYFIGSSNIPPEENRRAELINTSDLNVLRDRHRLSFFDWQIITDALFLLA